MKTTVFEVNSRRYLIGGRAYVQQELTWGQDGELGDLVAGMLAKISGSEPVTQHWYIQQLFNTGLIDKFLCIVLKPEPLSYWDRVRLLFKKEEFDILEDVGKAPNTAISQIFEDFFLLNRGLIARLTESAELLSTVAREMIQAAKMENLQLTSKAKISRKSGQKKTTKKDVSQNITQPAETLET